jgi:hypothetical protein
LFPCQTQDSWFISITFRIDLIMMPLIFSNFYLFFIREHISLLQKWNSWE